MRALVGLFLFGGMTSVAMAVPTWYVDVVNDAKTGVAAFATAVPDGPGWQRLVIGDRSLQANGAATLALQHAGGCQRDFRIDFVDGRRMIVRDFDICRRRSLHLGAALARAR